jgi:hypothetical protein
LSLFCASGYQPINDGRQERRPQSPALVGRQETKWFYLAQIRFRHLKPGKTGRLFPIQEENKIGGGFQIGRHFTVVCVWLVPGQTIKGSIINLTKGANGGNGLVGGQIEGRREENGRQLAGIVQH